MQVVDTDLTDTNSDFCYTTIQRIKEIVDLSDAPMMLLIMSTL